MLRSYVAKRKSFPLPPLSGYVGEQAREFEDDLALPSQIPYLYWIVGLAPGQRTGILLPASGETGDYGDANDTLMRTMPKPRRDVNLGFNGS